MTDVDDLPASKTDENPEIFAVVMATAKPEVVLAQLSRDT